MNLKKAIMLGVTFAGIVGVAGVAIAGQNAIASPETFATGGTTAKTKIFTQTTTVIEESYGAYNHYIAAGTCDNEGNPAHDKIGFNSYYSGSYDYVRYNGVGYFVEGSGEQYGASFTIGLNGITGGSMTYKYNSSYPTYFHYYYRGSHNNDLVTDENNTVTTTGDGTAVFDFQSYAGTDAVKLYFKFVGRPLTIVSLTLNWAC